MLEDIWKEARILDMCKAIYEKITVCIQEIFFGFEYSGALATSDETQLRLALITYMYRAGACYDVEIHNFTVHAAVQAIVQLDQSTAEQDEFEINTLYVLENWQKNKRTVNR